MRTFVAAFVLVAVHLAASAAEGQKRPSDEQRGKELYDRHCVACHGVAAEGDGPATAALVVPVPNLQGKTTADQAAIDLVEMGRGPMPSFEASFDADDARRVLVYMGKLGGAPPEPPPAAPAAAPAPPPAPTEDVPD